MTSRTNNPHFKKINPGEVTFLDTVYSLLGYNMETA